MPSSTQNPWGVASVEPTPATPSNPWGVAETTPDPQASSSVFDAMRANVASNAKDLPPHVYNQTKPGESPTFGDIADRVGGAFHDYVAAPLVHVANRAATNIANPVIDFAENVAMSPEEVQAKRQSQAEAAWQHNIWNPQNNSKTPIRDTAEAFGNAIPLVPGAGSQARGYANSEHPIADVAGDALTAGLAGGVAKTFPEGGVPNPISAVKNKWNPTSSPDIVTPIKTAAEKLTTAVVPKSGRAPGFTRDMIDQLPNVKDYAARTNNPLRTQAEFEEALRGAGKERYDHYKNEILDPNKDAVVDVPDQYEGTTTSNGKAKIGDINRRIGRINDLLSPNYAKINPGDVSTAMAKATPEQLSAEHATLTNVLHKELGSRTGIVPNDIARLRQDFGKLHDLQNTVTEARTGRMVGVGATNEGGAGGGIGLPHPSPAGVATKVLEGIKGGRTAIADRAFQSAWKDMSPLAGDPNPLPQSPAGFKDAANARAAANHVAAQQEFLRSSNLEQSAQDAAQQRANLAAQMRQGVTQNAQQQNTQNFIHSSNLEQSAQEAAQQRADLANRMRQGISGAARDSNTQDFVHASNLEQAAQDAAAGRSQRATDLRSSRVATDIAQRKLEGEAARTIGRQNAIKAQGNYAHYATDPTGRQLGSMDGRTWFDVKTGQPMNTFPAGKIPPPPQ